ncbi:hypothetical protein M404DRAFT_33339 [Pisolithus tinctorius Marx 270]|uniref:Uncharacterized protein n=1 Tax=Pisolithus tinctorius Marx 270 TaxID=870435 RepID=A0A0C3NM60_PISTI|nr:hypothetical protein M404DRAFT_33339 [Pisolithus tinctorius Marx 270]
MHHEPLLLPSAGSHLLVSTVQNPLGYLDLFLQLEPTARDSAVASRRSLRRTAECTKLENLCLHFHNLNLSEDSNIFCPVSPITLDHAQLPADIPWVLPAITPPDILADQISIVSDHLDLTAPDFPGGFIHLTPQRPETPPSPLTPVTSSDSSSPMPSLSCLFDTSESIPRLSVPSTTLLRPLTQLQTTHQPISNLPTLLPAHLHTIPTTLHPQPIPVPPITNLALPPQVNPPMANPQFQMLLHSTQNSPKFSRDSPTQLPCYLKEINFLGTLAAVDDRGKIRAAIRYADLEEAKVWQMLPAATPTANDWDAFVVAVKGLYPGCEGDDHYCHMDLQYLVKEYQSKPTWNQDDLREYQWKFAKISALLIKTKKLAETEWDSMFLNGFPRAITDRIHHRLSIVCTDLHPDNPYPLAEVIKATKFLLMGSTLHSAVPMMGTVPSPAAPPSSAYMLQVPPAGTVVKQEYNFQTQPLPQQCRPGCGFCADPNHWTRMCMLVEVYICAGKIMRGTDNCLYLVDGSQIPCFPECNSLREAVDHIMADRDQAIDVQLEIQPSAFLNTVQDADEPVADLADPDFQAYATQAWATYQADKGNKGAVIPRRKKARFDGVEITA